MAVLEGAEKAVYNTGHPSDDSPCTDLNESDGCIDVNPDNHNSLQLIPTPCKCMQNKDLWARLDSNQRPTDYE
ncbi:MAG: hypothetical protein ABFR90_05770, partial [Planctomycetota bacterium]